MFGAFEKRGRVRVVFIESIRIVCPEEICPFF